MTRRLGLFAIAISFVALPALARRRVVTPGGPSHCIETTVAAATYAQVLAQDAQYVYFISEFGELGRVPKLGGEVDLISDELGEWLPLSMVVDDTHVYIGALPFEALFTPRPGAILKVPKSGGVVSTLLSDVLTPFEVALDDTHVYWAAAGTLDLLGGSIDPDGKIERVKKNGTSRQTLANGLSAPLGLALDSNDVYFGQSGIADGDPTVGLYRVAKSGGTVATLDDDTVVVTLALDGNTIVFLGGNETTGGLLAAEKNAPSAMRALYGTESISGGLRIADRRVYFLEEPEESDTAELSWVSIDTPAGRVGVRKDLDGDAFLLDGCAAVVNTMEGDLARVRR